MNCLFGRPQIDKEQWLILCVPGDMYREIIFMCCSGLLLIVSAVIGVLLHE